MRDFARFFEECVRYRETHGNLYIPAVYQIDGYKLGDKVHNVRRGRIVTSDEEKKCLDEIGFVWKVRNDYTFSQVYRLLLNFKALNGHCNVPLGFKTASGIPLGRLALRIQNRWKKLTPEQEEKLQKIGFQINESRYKPKKHYEDMVKRSVKGYQMLSNYQIISFSHPIKEVVIQEITSLVNTYMEQGYFPTGNLCIDKNKDGYTAYQPVVLLD